MDTTLVNWEVLDALVIDFAKSEHLIDETTPSTSAMTSPLSSPTSSSTSTTTCSSSLSSSSSSYQSRLIIRQIRRAIESGDIDSALDLLRSHAPSVLLDHRLLFRLQKQKFIELLRKGTEEGRDFAIECIRTALAPCALDAYPEAYEEFKHVLLAFIYDKDDQGSPVANEWSEKRRSDIAGLMTSVLRAHLHAYDPVFSMTLRYLISIHKAFCLRQGMSSPISDLTVRLLLEDRDPPAVPQETMCEAPPFDEVDIQALAHAVELTRQGAIDSLKFAKGDLLQAFQNELCRIKVDMPMLDELVREYCVYRGIVDYSTVSASVSDTIEVDQTTSKQRDTTPSCHAHMDDFAENNVNANSRQGADVELRYVCESTSTCEDCSTSESAQAGIFKFPRNNGTYTSGERSKRKRWRGRQDDLGISFNGRSKQNFNAAAFCTTVSRDKQSSEKSSIFNIDNRQDKYEFVLGMKEQASSGMAAEVVGEVNAFDPNFFVQNHIILFQLKQVEFLKLVGAGDHSSALRVACSHLGPLATRDPALLKPLKETLLALLRPDDYAHGNGLPLHDLATSLQVALGWRLGIEEPQLMKIMRATIHTHEEWFKLQMCKDHFESLLKIDVLREANAPLLSACSVSKSHADSCTQGSSQVTISSSARASDDGSSPAQVSSSDVCDENAILKVMEFLALPRADAIHLLAQYNGNAETVIQQIFS